MANQVQVSEVLATVDFASIAAAAAAKLAKTAKPTATTEKVVTASAAIIAALESAEGWQGQVIFMQDPMPNSTRPFAKRAGEYAYEVHTRTLGWRAVKLSLLPDGIMAYCQTGSGMHTLKDSAAEVFANNPANWNQTDLSAEAPAPQEEAPTEDAPPAQE